MKTIFASVRFFIFALWCALQLPTAILIASWWRGFGASQFTLFARVSCVLFGIRRKVIGTPSKYRPLLVISNHTSVFEMLTFPTIFGNRFFGKAEIRKYPIVGPMVGFLGTLFIDRNPAKAAEGIELLRRTLSGSRRPFAIFPEGTTDNGAHILPFKSAMFDFLKDVPEVKIQPVALIYRDRRGNKIDPQLLADEYAFFDNAKQAMGPYCKRELSVVELLYAAMKHGGFTAEMHIMPLFDATGKDRKLIAAELHEIVASEFYKNI